MGCELSGCTVQAWGDCHPDSMKLDRGLTPLLLAAYVRVRKQEHDRRLKEIMRTLLRRGARITQREACSGATVMHLLACQPAQCSTLHRTRVLLNKLEEYRNGPKCGTPMRGLSGDPVLNLGPVADSGSGGSVVSIAVHLLGMRDNRGFRPEDRAPKDGSARNYLRQRRVMLPPVLQDAGRS